MILLSGMVPTFGTSYDRHVWSKLKRRLRPQGGFYCDRCGYWTRSLLPFGPEGKVFCDSCGERGMRVFENARPVLVPCPEPGCLMRVWDDGVVNSAGRQHHRHAPASVQSD